MSYAYNQGIRIHYQVIGDGPPLVLQHGFSASIMDWYEFGYVEKLSEEYRLILIDARGHGASDKPHESDAYTLELFVSDIAVVLADLQIKKTNYMGYSMGGWIGFGMAKYAPERLNSLIIGGAQPYGLNFEGVRELLSNGLNGWMAVVEGWGIYSGDALARMWKNDAKALLALIQDRLDMANILPSISMPCLIYAGSGDNQFDRIERCAKELSNATFVSLPGLDHIGIIPRSDLVIPNIIKFLRAV